MLIKPSTCPICEAIISNDIQRCPKCRCITQLGFDIPQFTRTSVDEQIVQSTIERSRELLRDTPHNGVAHYVLGLCYLNFNLQEQSLDELNQAADLLPERDTLRFELALLYALSGNYTAAQEHIRLALQLAPESLPYRYFQQYLRSMLESEHGETQAAIGYLIAAYQLMPDAIPAHGQLRKFVEAHEAKLTQTIARSLPGLDSADAERLKLLNSNPDSVPRSKLRAPATPRDLGKISMRLLRKLSSARAAAIEQMHTERLVAHQTAVTTYEAQREQSDTQHEAMRADWQARVGAIRGDLATMARLCLAVVAEEERRRLAEEQRQAEIEQRRREAEQRRTENEQRRREADQQRQLEQQQRAQAQAAAPRAAPAPREKQFLSTRARYLQGLPLGRANDAVSLTVTNHRIVLKHSVLVGSWEQIIPMQMLTEVAPETVKHLLSSEKRLRLSYRDEQGMVAHAVFSDLRVDDCVKKILQARSNS
jgi:hypothetical protein